MKNNKGFTLVELMAVIAIMAVIIGIAVPSYIGITKSTNQKMYESKVTEIKTKAEQYASENNIDNTTITVTDLINEGYYEVDNAENDEGSQVTNPLGGYMDCDIVYISKNDGEYVVTVQDNTDCSISTDDTSSSKITIYAYEYNNSIGSALGSNSSINWTSKDVLLYADLSAIKDIIVNNKVTWTAGSTVDIKNKTITSALNKKYDKYSNEILVSASLFLNANYMVSVETSEGVISKNVTVKIDKEAPYVDSSVNDVWTKGTKQVTLTGSDGTGSGVDKFYVASNTTKPNSDDFNIISNNNQGTIDLDVGTYYAYSKDSVGNISDAKKIIITNVDKTGPVCKYANVPTTFYYNGTYSWSHDDISLTYGCASDYNQSGCQTGDTTKTYSGYANETINWTISDNVGNTTNCSQAVETKIDKTTPSVSPNQNPISLGNQDYDFTSNVSVGYGQGSGSVVCDPASSRKTGSYNVTCTATGNNGLTASTTFLARHNYTAGTYTQYYSESCNCHDCGCRDVNCWTEFFQNTHCGVSGCGTPDYTTHCDTQCNTCCDTCSRSRTVYYCPNGGTLSGTTCYF